MKRYENMEKEEIVNALTGWYDSGCDGCILSENMKNCRGKVCISNIQEYLTEELPVKKVIRASTLKTKEDILLEHNKFNNICTGNDTRCTICAYERYNFPDGGEFTGCWDRYLAEEIEVEEG